MATLNLSTAHNMLVGGREASSLYLPRLGKIWEHPYSYVVHNTAGTWYYNAPIPLWCNSIYFEMIGGGGGGQTGNGTNGASGVPGRGATWIQQGYNLNRADGETYVYDYYIGKGGAGGTNSDHSAGKDGEMSEVSLKRIVGGTETVITSFSSQVLGKGGPASGLSQGATSGGVSSKNSVRSYIQLPSAAGVAKEIVGNSPGGGGGYGGGGYFGARGTGRAGGNGRIYVFFLGDRV